MKNVWLAALSLALMGVIDIQIASPQEAIGQSDLAYEHWVDYRDGEISLAFYKAPVQAALDAIHAQTGLKIVLPSVPEAKLLSLTVNRLPIEPAVRSLISSIGFRNFALLYDEAGRPSAAVVLDVSKTKGIKDGLTRISILADHTNFRAATRLTRDDPTTGSRSDLMSARNRR